MALEDMNKLFIGLGTITIVMVVAFLIASQGKTQIGLTEGLIGGAANHTACVTSEACNATDTIINSMDDAVDWLPIIVITVIGAALIGLVAFFRRRR